MRRRLPSILRHPTRGCSASIVSMMDKNGVDWCRSNADYILEDIRCRCISMRKRFDSEAAAWLLADCIRRASHGSK